MSEANGTQQCLKCGHVVRVPSDLPNGQLLKVCPSCGAVQEKIRRLLLETENAIENAIAPRAAPVERRLTYHQWTLVLAAMIGLVAGYFAGREHVKYQMRSAFSDAFGGLAERLGGVSDRLSGAASKKKTEPKKYPITARLRTITSYGASNGGTIGVSIEFTNATGKLVKAFDGAAIFSDLLGNEILRTKVTVKDPTQPDGLMQWGGEIPYNDFKPAHKELRQTPESDVRFSFELSKVLFESGEIVEY